MLKTLEEPAAFAHLILLTSRLGNVLPTIASRCQAVRFDAASSEQIAAQLEGHGVPPEVAGACGRLALGDAERALALALADGPALRGASERLARGAIADQLGDQPWNAMIAIARAHGEAAAADVKGRVAADQDLLPAKERKRAEREGDEQAKRAQRRAQTLALDQGLQLTGLWLRDVAAVADGAEEVVHHTDRLAELREDAAGADAHRLRAGVALVDETRISFEVNPSEELALEALAYRLAAAVAGG
jgi:DNA polymerase-3 subunit delta'